MATRRELKDSYFEDKEAEIQRGDITSLIIINESGVRTQISCLGVSSSITLLALLHVTELSSCVMAAVGSTRVPPFIPVLILRVWGAGK